MRARFCVHREFGASNRLIADLLSSTRCAAECDRLGSRSPSAFVRRFRARRRPVGAIQRGDDDDVYYYIC